MGCCGATFASGGLGPHTQMPQSVDKSSTRTEKLVRLESVLPTRPADCFDATFWTLEM